MDANRGSTAGKSRPTKRESVHTEVSRQEAQGGPRKPHVN